MNSLCRLLGIDVPILQAPVGSIAGPELCAAVSEAGGLGAMGVTWTPPSQIRENIERVKALTGHPFQVNFVLHFDPVGLDVALEAKVPVVTFSWGNPGPLIAKSKAAGAIVGVQCTTPAGAALMAAQGADFIVFQGNEAGGHVQSHLPLDALLAEAADDSPPLPYAAAGGLATAKDVRRVLDAGAQAAMLGTRFVATQESRAHEEYKARLLEATAEDTVLSYCFDIGWPQSRQRLLRNATFQTWEAAGCPNAGRRWGEGDILGHTANQEPIYRYEDVAPRVGMTGEIEEMCLYAGTGVGAIDDLPPAGDLVRRLWPN